MRILFVIVTSFLLSASFAASATGRDNNSNRFNFKVLETGYEGPFFDFYLGKDLTGHVKTKVCESSLNCKTVVFKITPDVKALLDGMEVPLSMFVMSTQQPSVLHVDNKTHNVNRISWNSPRK